MELQATLKQFHTADVQDLAWALLSPSLMKTTDHSQHCSEAFYQQAFNDILPHLIQLDQHPKPLQDHLERTTSHRLGPHFERLWLYWLRHNSRYECLAHNVQIQEEGKTLGEFDMIVQDKNSGEIEHWELAIKFYLGIPPLNNETHWLGPHQKDRLDLKFHHLVEKQLKLSTLALARKYCEQQGWKITRSRLISKGRLFYPLNAERTHPGNIEKHHLIGHWMTESDFRIHFARAQQTKFHWLDKDEWMVLRNRPATSFTHIDERLQKQRYPHPVQLLVTDWHEQPIRLFIVPENWLDRAMAILAQ